MEKAVHSCECLTGKLRKNRHHQYRAYAVIGLTEVSQVQYLINSLHKSLLQPTYIQCDTTKCHLERQVLTPLYCSLALQTLARLIFTHAEMSASKTLKATSPIADSSRQWECLQTSQVHITGTIKALKRLQHSRSYLVIKR